MRICQTGKQRTDATQTRYRSLAETRHQHIATADALNLERLVAWFLDTHRATTRTSRFAALSPT